jgi:hypothetical protein
MNSSEKALIAESDECIDCEDYKLGYLAGLRRAAEIASVRADRAGVIDYRAGIRHTMQDIESEASLIEGTGEKT